VVVESGVEWERGEEGRGKGWGGGVGVGGGTRTSIVTRCIIRPIRAVMVDSSVKKVIIKPLIWRGASTSTMLQRG
jgi:hypothetical protein